MSIPARFAGKTVLITGAAGGIGQAAARRLAAEGAQLALTDIAREPLDALARELGDRVVASPGDIATERAMDDVIQAALDAFGRIDAAFLNAGAEGRIAPFGKADLADFERVMAINVRGPFIGLNRLMPLMKDQGHGSIVLTSSTAGLRGSPSMAPYVASKHAVLGLMRCAALEGAPYGVRVNTLHPGPVDTAMIHNIEHGFAPDNPEAAARASLARLPLKRYGTPEEVAALLAYVLSDEAAFCTGSAFSIDGGLMAGTPVS